MHYFVEASRSFQSMNTGIETVVCVPEDQKPEAESALNTVQNWFLEAETRLSRFHPNSELSQLNRSYGRSFKASSLLYEVTAAAMNSAELTGGIFDPTILPYLAAAGYDRSFEMLKKSRRVTSMNSALLKNNWREISLDQQNRTISLPEGCSIDLGGIAKGWMVDQAGRYLEKFQNYAINAGGDIIVRGTQTDGSSWTIGIEDPKNKKPNLAILYLSGGAVCTSTVSKRKWRVNGIQQHHLIDPRTGAPANSGVISATVTAGSATLAETITKAALILGPQEGLDLIESCEETEGMLVLEDGSHLTSRGFPKFLERSTVSPGLNSSSTLI